MRNLFGNKYYILGARVVREEATGRGERPSGKEGTGNPQAGSMAKERQKANKPGR